MEFRHLGISSLRVSLVGLGCNNFGVRIDLETARKVLHKALDLGITMIDTADIYGKGGSETFLGEIMGHRRNDPGARHQIRNADGRDARARRRVAPLHHDCGRGQPKTTANRSYRPVPAFTNQTRRPRSRRHCVRLTT